MSWYTLSKLIDKDPSPNVTHWQCAWCKKFATHDENDPNTAIPIWKSLEELNPEDKKEALLSL